MAGGQLSFQVSSVQIKFSVAIQFPVLGKHWGQSNYDFNVSNLYLY